jgi:acyl-CoA reductase-like NAD-dependent aldehyde dehydrogenase
MCGNTVVLKSSEYSPRTQALAVQLFHEAGFPNGVVNYISMSRESSPALTAQIIGHPLVRKINVGLSACIFLPRDCLILV